MDLSDLTKHFSTPGGEAFDVTPEAAVDFFTAKGLKPTFRWQEMIGREHAVAFTVAKMMDVDLLKDVRESLDLAIANGTAFKTWADELTPLLQKKGWWGKTVTTDPNTGFLKDVRLGSPARLQTIFRTNLQSAYAVGQWEQIEQQAAEAPYLLYDAVDDQRTRPEHAAWDGKVLPVTSEWWKSHSPPNGWNCRCSVIQLDEDDLEQLGLEVEPRAPRFETYKWTNPITGKVFDIPFGVDPGFGTAAANRITKMQDLLRQKASNLPSDMVPSAEKGLAALKAETELAAQQSLKELAQGLGQSRLARSQEKVAQLAAELEIQNAQVSKIPYLAKALKDILKTPQAARMKPGEILAQAKEKAAKQKQSAMLHDWKKAYLSGKTPTAKQKGAFDALPDEAKSSMLADLDAQIEAAKAAQAAQAAIDEALQASPGSTLGKAVAQLQKADKWDTSNPVALKSLLDETADQVKQQKAMTDAVSAYKKNAIAGKVPTPAQKAAFDSLPDDKKEKLLGEIQSAKAKAAPETPAQAPKAAPEPEIDTENLVQIGPQGGSNPGGLYQDVTTGRKWYIKTPASPDIARNEVLAAKLYEAAGVDVPTLRLVEFNGRTSIASEIVEGLVKGSPADLARAAGTADGFGVDAWLANWDVVGLGYDNLLLKGSKAFRVDTGGALRYRAQGGLKGTAFGRTVDEIDSLRDPRTNGQSASVYGDMTPAQLEASVRKVLQIDDDDIRALVRQFGPLDTGEADALADLLIARKADLYKRFPGARPLKQPPAEIADPTAAVSPVEFKAITDSRVNGYSIKTDKDQIEDHNVLISHFRQPGGGGEMTRAQLKLTPSAGKDLETRIKEAVGGQNVVADASPASAKILELIKGVNSRAAKGEVLEQKNIDRMRDAVESIDNALQAIRRAEAMPGVDRALLKAQGEFLEQWRDTIRNTLRNLSASDKAVAIPGKFDPSFLKPIIKVEKGVDGGIEWKRTDGWSVRRSEFSRGYATMTGNRQGVPGVDRAYTAEIDGVRVDYIPFEGNPGGRAFQGTVHIDVSGATPEAAAKAFATLEKMGINVARATDIDRKELYTNKLARLYTVKDRSRAAQWERLNAIADQNQRIREKIQWLNGVTGKDIETSDYFASYHGQHQAFGHGRSLQFRADLDEGEFRAFSKKYVIYHNPTGLGWGASDNMINRLKVIFEGGGMLISAAERVRRGVSLDGGTSIAPDIRTGGGNYVFTRLGKLSGASRHKYAGIYWSPSNLRRADAISYDGDKFGETTDQMLSTRAVNPAEWQKAATNSRNETIFKDGLSVFDDVERIIFPRASDYREMVDWLRGQGYDKWPDGRTLEEVLGYVGQ